MLAEARWSYSRTGASLASPSLFTQRRGRGILRSSERRGGDRGGLPRPLPAQARPPKGPPASSSSAPPRRPRNCTLSATTSTLLLLEPSSASQVLYCSLPSTRMGSPFFL